MGSSRKCRSRVSMGVRPRTGFSDRRSPPVGASPTTVSSGPPCRLITRPSCLVPSGTLLSSASLHHQRGGSHVHPDPLSAYPLPGPPRSRSRIFRPPGFLPPPLPQPSRPPLPLPRRPPGVPRPALPPRPPPEDPLPHASL